MNCSAGEGVSGSFGFYSSFHFLEHMTFIQIHTDNQIRANPTPTT